MFTAAVAKGRGVPPASGRDGYGKRHILTADQAIQGSMIDKIRSVCATLAAYGMTSAAPSRSTARTLARGSPSGSLPRFPYPNDAALRRAPRSRQTPLARDSQS
jgi:hypothetical protein